MDERTNKSYRLSWIAIAVAALCLLGAVALDGGVPSAAVMLLFFVGLPIFFLLGVGCSLVALFGGKKAALLPLVILLTFAVYVAHKLA